MPNLEQATLEAALLSVIDDKTLKSIGFGFGKDGVHCKLNEILKHIDLKIDIASAKVVKIQGKASRVNTYKLTSISAESILAGL
jgi:hypothetical protein